MAKPLVDDELWALIEPILPAPKPRHFRYPGRLPLSNRAVLNGIIFVLKTGIRWIDLPAELAWKAAAQPVPRADARAIPDHQKLALGLTRLEALDERALGRC